MWTVIALIWKWLRPRGVSLLSNPKALIALAAVGLLVAGYVAGRNSGATKAREAALVSRITSLQRDLAVSHTAARLSAEARQREETRVAELKKGLERYEQEMSASGACRLSDDDARRLRALTGR